MELEFIIKVISTVVIAAMGWIIVHYFTSRRDMANKRREIKTQYLIEAYQKMPRQQNLWVVSGSGSLPSA